MVVTTVGCNSAVVVVGELTVVIGVLEIVVLSLTTGVVVLGLELEADPTLSSSEALPQR